MAQVEEMLSGTPPAKRQKLVKGASQGSPQLPVSCLGLGCQISFKLSQVAHTCQKSESCWKANLDELRSQLRGRAVSPNPGTNGNLLG